MKSQVFPVLIILVFFALTARGQNMQLALDAPEWAGVKAHPVKGRTGVLIKQKISFGDIFTTEIKRSWTRGSSVTTGFTIGIPTDHDYRKLITTDYIDKKQTLFISLQDSAGALANAYCVSRFSARDFNIGNNSVSLLNLAGDLFGAGVSSESLFYVQIYTEGESPWHLVLDNEASQRAPATYRTRLLKSDSRFYTIIPDSRVKSRKGKVANMLFGAAGFQFRDPDGNAVAAVSMIDKGVIYLKELTVQERIVIAAAATALLLQEQI